MKCVLDDRQAAARGICTTINPRNRRENFLTKDARASLMLPKGPSHIIEA
ncbi:MAG: hypothetical protein WBE85_08735 [Methylocella sp.]